MLVLTLSVLATATISGVLGMGGGLLLMALLAACLPPPAAIALHGVIQLTTNGSRALLLRKAVDRRVLFGHALGAALSAALLASVALVVDRTTLFLSLGSVAVAASLWGRRVGTSERRVDLRSLPLGIGCGALVTATHLVAGVAGPLLDVFYLGSPLSRQAVVATKAATQSLSHALKIAYFAALAPSALTTAALAPWALGLLAVAGLGGTLLGTALLDRLSEERFRELTRWAVLAVGLAYLARGLAALWAE